MSNDIQERKLKLHIRKLLKKNIDKSKLVTAAINMGWSEDTINRIIAEIESPPENTEDVLPENLPEQAEEVTDSKVRLSQRVKDIDTKLDMMTEKNKLNAHKMFKLPFGIKGQLKTLAIKNRILVFFLTTNRTIKPLIAEIKNDFIVINGTPHNCSNDFVFLWMGKYPAIILPEWDLNPIGTKNYYDALEEGRTADAAKTIIKMIESGEVETKAKLGGKALIFIIIGAIVVAYLIFGGGK